MCSCIWLAPPRLAFSLAICGVGHPLSIIIWFNKVVVVVVDFFHYPPSPPPPSSPDEYLDYFGIPVNSDFSESDRLFLIQQQQQQQQLY